MTCPKCEEQQEEIERLTHLINMDWDCLPTCNSFGHDHECPYCNGEPKLRLLVERAERAEAEAIKWQDKCLAMQTERDAAIAAKESIEQFSHAKSDEILALRADAERWNAFVELWHASAELHATQDEDGGWSLTQFDAAEAQWTPGRWTGDTPDDAIAPIVAAIAQEKP